MLEDKRAGLTQSARRVLERAEQEARQSMHSHVGSEHILLGLVADADSIAARVLRANGADLQSVRQRVGILVLPVELSAGAISSQPTLTARAKRLIDFAAGEALNLRGRLADDTIETEHLLLGLIGDAQAGPRRTPQGIAADVLTGLGVDLDAVRSQLLVASGKRCKSEEA